MVEIRIIVTDVGDGIEFATQITGDGATADEISLLVMQGHAILQDCIQEIVATATGKGEDPSWTVGGLDTGAK